ncbi:MAG: hypothetical protein ABIQ88_10435 [Chitinophagaceae bacterium]
MIIIIIWLALSLMVALFLGAFRKIGFAKSLLTSIFLTPVVGLIVSLFSETKKAAAKKKDIERLGKEYLDLINPKK